MSTYQKASQDIYDFASDIIGKYECHHPLRDAKVKIDLINAYGDRDDDNNLIGDALKKNGIRAYGIAKLVSLKDRAMGRGDAEILIDNDYWELASEETRAALLDHEINHIQLKLDTKGEVLRDDLGRPKLKLRKHDVEFGWFNAVAQRHGVHSIERMQARTMMELSGQIYWPEIANANQGGRFGKIELEHQKAKA